MIVCPKCNRQLDDESKFCDSCGEKIPQSVVCSSCGKQMSEGFAFCQYCGTKMDAKQPVTAAVAASVSAPVSNTSPAASAPVSHAVPAPAPMPVQTAMSAPTPAPIPEQTAAPFVPMAQPGGATPMAAAVKKPFPKKAVLFGGIGLAAAAVIVVIIIIIVGMGKSLGNNFIIYAKDDGELYLNKFSGDPWQITERLGALSNSDIFEATDYIAACITVSKDGKTIFYPDRIGLNLYYRGINSENDGVRIDTSVLKYSVNESATVVTYIKAGDGNLYQYSLNSDEKNKIDSDVESFFVSDDGKKIVYYNNDNSIYFYNSDSDSREKIDSNSRVEYCSDDLTTLYYTKDDNLYKKSEGEDKVKIASDVQRVYGVYDSGEVYYIKLSKDDIPLINYIDDDMKEADALITEPVYPDSPDYPNYPTYPSRPYRFQYSSQEEYDKALEEYNKAAEEYEKELEKYNSRVEELREEYNAAIDKYYDDYDKYSEKTTRDYYREHLKDETLNYRLEAFCCYNGTEEKVYSAFERAYSSADAPVVVFSVYKQDQVPSIKLSEIKSIYEVSDMVNAALFSERQYYIAVYDDVSTLEGFDNNSYGIRIDDSGEHLYYFKDEDGYGSTTDLYSAAIVDGKVQTSELYDTDISCMSYATVTFFNGKIAYWKNISDDDYSKRGDLYVDKERVDYDIDYRTVSYDENAGVITYIVDADSNGKGTLKIYKNGSAEKISDDVSNYCVLPDGNILYLYDYNTNRNRGELHMYSNGTTEKVDDDVVTVFKITYEKYKGIDFYY